MKERKNLRKKVSFEKEYSRKRSLNLSKI